MRRKEISIDEPLGEVVDHDLENDPFIDGASSSGFGGDEDLVVAPWDDVPDGEALRERHHWRPGKSASRGEWEVPDQREIEEERMKREAEIEEEMLRRKQWDAEHSAGQPEDDDSTEPQQKMAGEPLASGTEEREQNSEPKKRSRLLGLVQDMLSGNVLEKSNTLRIYPYLLLLAFLAVVYIANGYRMQYLHRRHNALLQEVRELRTKSLTISSQRVDITRRTYIVLEVERRGLGLKEPFVPPLVIDK